MTTHITADPLFSQKFCKAFNGGKYNMARNKVKIEWERLPGFKLRATWTPGPRGLEMGLNESDMDPIQVWSKETGCGVRISFNMWRFRTPEEMTAFLLKWS